jgi:hypothetical protein
LGLERWNRAREDVSLQNPHEICGTNIFATIFVKLTPQDLFNVIQIRSKAKGHHPEILSVRTFIVSEVMN